MRNNRLIEMAIDLLDGGRVDLSAFRAQGVIPKGKVIFIVSDDRALSRSFSIALFKELNNKENLFYLFAPDFNECVASESFPVPESLIERRVSFAGEKIDFLKFSEDKTVTNSFSFCPVAYSDLRYLSNISDATGFLCLPIVVEKETKKKSLFEFNELISTFGGASLGIVYLRRRLFKTKKEKPRHLR